MKTTPYFSHKCDSLRDPAIQGLIADYGFAGYGRYWAIMEYLREHNGELPNDKITLRALALALQMNTEDLQMLCKSMVEDYHLLYISTENCFRSMQMDENLMQMHSISIKRKESAEKRWKCKSNANAQESNANAQNNMQVHTKSDANAMQKQPKNMQILNISSNTNVLEGDNILPPNVFSPPEEKLSREPEEPPKKPRRSKPPKLISEEAIRFADWFAKLLPDTVRTSDGSRRLWAEAYDKLIQQGRAKQEILQVCQWARADTFWKTNFLTAAKLTETKHGVQYFDIFSEKMKQERTNADRTTTSHSTATNGIRATDGKYSHLNF